ncbi:MAG: hypothetical protein AVDCRST_MAG28-227 [uncultured Rubrobacteraceae bacterium]|uniref:bis(5'-nucleosyl)-tetraphosphatase (symmetrical) n=1 Tax=uncultured Rubrobacteraceae bacterium TaxID=349277 RepID=A0A6J4QER0_9ACTN|nr:MAG: hypothetical protein AVDCRST_MAG28-227 [uncultured Rubrobacteraceae bacterium]
MIENSLLKDAENYARKRLSYKRYEHTLRVAETAGRLAELHGLDPDKARLAGLLHDASRETYKEGLLRLAEEADLPINELERERPMLLHGPVAAECARRDLGVKDSEVLEAVRVHTTGEPGMGPLALAVYLADKIEPGRDQPGVDGLRKLALKSLHRAAKAALEASISYNEQRGRPTHTKSLRALEWLENPGGKSSGEV